MSDAQPSAAAQTQQRLFQLGNQLAQLQQAVDALRAESEQSGQQLTTLVHHFTDHAAMQPIYEQLATLSTGLDANQERLDQMVRATAQQEQLERLIAVVASQQQVDELVDGVKKLTRTQFKSNTLAESKEQQVEHSLAALRDLATAREQIQSSDQRPHERLSQARADARVEFGAELLPALDSLALAIANGEALLARQQAQIATATPAAAPPPAPAVADTHPAPTSFWQRLFAPAPTALPPRATPPAAAPPVPPERALLQELQEGTRAWLQGLQLVQERFAGLLATEEITPIEALHQPFDPKLHVALQTETRTDVAPNLVVRVLRQGYRRHDRILRYAEVVVARQPTDGE